MISVGSMIKKLGGLLGTGDLNAWETEFVENIVMITDDGNKTTGLSAPRVETIERIHDKHFA